MKISRKARDIRDDLLSKIDGELDRINDNDMSLESRAMTLRTLSEALTNVINLEERDESEEYDET